MAHTLKPPLTPKQMSEDLGIHYTFVCRMLSGSRPMTLAAQMYLWGAQGHTFDGHPLAEWRERFRLARTQLGISQEALGQAVGYASRMSIIRIENGKLKTLGLAKFKLIAAELGLQLPTEESNDEHIPIQDDNASTDMPREATGQPAHTEQPTSST